MTDKEVKAIIRFNEPPKTFKLPEDIYWKLLIRATTDSVHRIMTEGYERRKRREVLFGIYPLREIAYV